MEVWQQVSLIFLTGGLGTIEIKELVSKSRLGMENTVPVRNSANDHA